MSHFLKYLKFNSFQTFNWLSDSPAPTIAVSPELVLDSLAPFVSCFDERIRNYFTFGLADKLDCPECCLILCCPELSLPFVANLCRSLGCSWALDLNH